MIPTHAFKSAAAAIALALAGTAGAQTTLRIGLAEDPDALDPSTARTYVGRIVFASICDKLFDIDEKLNIVPQLALSHETSADGKTVTIKLRTGVKFHDGEPFDAAAAKFSKKASAESQWQQALRRRIRVAAEPTPGAVHGEQPPQLEERGDLRVGERGGL
jgi:ABC-type transport system substrate-binding protein